MHDLRSSTSSGGPPMFPVGDHKWSLAVQRVSLADYFVPSPDCAVALQERVRWLTEDPVRYAQLLPAAAPLLAETLPLLQQSLIGSSPYERLLELGRRCEHDLVWLLPDETGAWNVVGGVVCFPSEWGLGEKLGRPLAEVHGPVPQLNEVLANRIDTFLNGFDARFGWRRLNWSLARDAERNHHPDRRLPKLDATTRPEETFVRWEHQLLARLPQSGAILFALRIELQSLVDLKADAEASARLARQLETMSPEIAGYKNVKTSRERLIAYLRA